MRPLPIIALIVAGLITFLLWPDGAKEIQFEKSAPIQVTQEADGVLQVEATSNREEIVTVAEEASAVEPEDYWLREGNWMRINPKYHWINDPKLVDQVLAILDDEYWIVKQKLAHQAGVSDMFDPKKLARTFEKDSNRGDFQFEVGAFSTVTEYWAQEKLANIISAVNSRQGQYGKQPLLAEDDDSDFIREKLREEPHKWPVEYLLADIVQGRTPELSSG